MSDLSEIVDLINTGFTNSTGQFKGKPFQKGRITGLCKQIDRVVDESTNEKLIIEYNDSNGLQGTEILIDDKYPFQIYHRIKGTEAKDSEEDYSFGDDDEQKIVIFTMGLIVIVDKLNVEQAEESIATALALNMPKTIKPSQISGSQFSNCSITIGEIERETATVFSNEYGFAKSIPQQYYMMDLSYTLEISYNKACYNLC